MERALRLYTLLVDYFPDQGGYLSRLSDLYASLGKPEEAKAVYDRILGQNPETAYVIGRERLFGSASLEEIVERVQEMTAKTQRIRADAALFGIALMKRDAGDKQNRGRVVWASRPVSRTASGFVQAAAREAALLDGQTPKAFSTSFHADASPRSMERWRRISGTAPPFSRSSRTGWEFRRVGACCGTNPICTTVTGTGAEKPNRITDFIRSATRLHAFRRADADCQIRQRDGTGVGLAGTAIRIEWRSTPVGRFPLTT
jgi:hypothetical protein